MAHENIVADY